jgi:hypothetical protein
LPVGGGRFFSELLVITGERRGELWRYGHPMDMTGESEGFWPMGQKGGKAMGFLDYCEWTIERAIFGFLAIPEGDALAEGAAAGDIGAMRAALAAGCQRTNLALAWAASANQPLAAAYLLDQGASMDRGGGEALSEAARRGNLDIIRPLASRDDCSVKMLNDALRDALELGETGAAKELLEAGANSHRESPHVLLGAKKRGDEKLVALLREHGALEMTEEEAREQVRATLAELLAPPPEAERPSGES